MEKLPVERQGINYSHNKSQLYLGEINEDQFVCSGGNDISVKGISKHFSDCSEMKSKYSKLFMDIDKLVTKEAKSVQDWMNIKHMFTFLEGHMKMMIKKELKSGTNFKKKNDQNGEHSPKDLSTDGDEERIPDKNYFDKMKNNDYEENKYEIADQIYRQESMQRCPEGQKYITPADEKAENLGILEGACYFHLNCMKRTASKQYMDKQEVVCTKCKEGVSRSALNQYFGSTFVEDLDDKLLESQILQDSNMVRGTCKNYIEVVPGDVDYKQKDEEGHILSKKAAENMAYYRVRCNSCSRIFCSKCNTDPYHIGKTCEEFDEYRGADKCRFCLDKLSKIRKGVSPAFRAVCKKGEGEELINKGGDRQLEGGHFCGGTKHEQVCLPGLDSDCVKLSPGITLEQTGDDYCNICYAGGLSQGPGIQLDCKHIFHEECLITVLKGKWSGPRINFQYIKCPSCKSVMSSFHIEASRLIKEALTLEKKIDKMALQRAKHEGIDKDDRLKEPPYSGNLGSYAVARLSYYMCFKCKKPYFGGLKSCENNNQQNNEKFKPDELVGASCSADAVGGGIKDCKTHGKEYIEFKCKFCCKVAQWFCWGNTHFCDEGHTKQNKGEYLTKKKISELPQCKTKKNCPLKVDHPENGKEEYALGCAICRNMVDNQKEF